MTLINVAGTVFDWHTGSPLEGVTIEKLNNGKGTGQIVLSSVNGLYNIPIIDFNGLRFSHVGYKTQTFLDGAMFDGTANVAMVRDVQVLPDVVVSASRSSSLLW
mgnify:FL=1